MNIIEMVEVANSLSEHINACYADINDIDFMINNLKKKKKTISNRANKYAHKLKDIINNKLFNNAINKDSKDKFLLILNELDEFINKVNLDT